MAVPGILTGIGTLALAALTVSLAAQQRNRDDEIRRADLQRNEALRLEVSQAEESRAGRAHAELISAWVAGPTSDKPPGWYINLSNGSDQLAYNVVVIAVQIQGEGPSTGEIWNKYTNISAMPCAVLHTLPPGGSWIRLDSKTGGGVEIGFTDRAGRSWIRRSWGALEEIATTAPFYYDIDNPVQYRLDLHSGRYYEH